MRQKKCKIARAYAMAEAKRSGLWQRLSREFWTPWKRIVAFFSKKRRKAYNASLGWAYRLMVKRMARHVRYNILAHGNRRPVI